MRGAAVLCALALLLIPAAAAKHPSPHGSISSEPLSFYLYQNDLSQPVDYLTWCGDCVNIDYTAGSPWVVNPGTYWPFADLSFLGAPVSSLPGCLWDSDDGYQYQSSGGVLAGGASVTVRECRYAGGKGGPYHPTDIWLQSSSPDLVVSETWTWDAATVTATISPVRDQTSRLWTYFDCLYSPPDPGGATDGGSKVEIPGSHGGYAIPQRVDVTVANPSWRKASKTGGVIEAGLVQGANRGCGSIGWWHFP